MMPTMNSKISHDYRFLPDLLMPIVTIDEVHNERARNFETSNQRRNVKKEDLIDLSQKADKIDISTTQGDSNTTSQNVSDNIEIKTEDTTDEDKLPILAVKTEKDLTDIDVEKQAFASELKLKIKEEITDSEENITSNKTEEEEDILQSVSRVIQLASSKNEVAKNTVLSTETNHCIEAPDIKKMEDLSVPNGPPPQPEKRKRGRPRKTDAEKTQDTKTKGKKTRGRRRKNKKSKKLKKTQSVKVTRKDESDLPRYPCPICKDDEMRTEKQLRQHYKSDHGGRRLRTAMLSTEMVPCDVCGKEFKSAYHLKEHMETHNNYYCCEICNSSHRKVLDYVIHMRIHSDKGFFKCLFCPYITEEIVEITKHINHSHEETSPHVCQICKKSFSLLSWYEEHSNFHSGLKPFSCDVCGKYFMYSRYLFAHKNFMHKELGSYNIHECVICHKQYQHRNSLKLHMNSHTGNFAICDVCGKILSSREKLKFHMRTHTGYKPFDCSYCGKCFTKKPILVEHIRIHTGERPYVCEYCTKAFSQRSSLVIHIRSHTGERPFVCQFCHKGFVAKAMLNIHLKTCKGLIVYE